MLRDGIGCCHCITYDTGSMFTMQTLNVHGLVQMLWLFCSLTWNCFAYRFAFNFLTFFPRLNKQYQATNNGKDNKEEKKNTEKDSIWLFQVFKHINAYYLFWSKKLLSECWSSIKYNPFRSAFNIKHHFIISLPYSTPFCLHRVFTSVQRSIHYFRVYSYFE